MNAVRIVLIERRVSTIESQLAQNYLNIHCVYCRETFTPITSGLELA